MLRRACLANALVFIALSSGCNADAPPRGPEAICVRSCEARAGRCAQSECARGCNLVLDRLVEGEGDRVLACVANSHAACDDRAWAHCATRVGIHADGGPPAPPPPQDVEEE